MINSKQKVKDHCDSLMSVNPNQIIIDFVQDDIEEVLYGDEDTPDMVGSLQYTCGSLLSVYNPAIKDDVEYLKILYHLLNDWRSDLEFANKTLGIDPNK